MEKYLWIGGLYDPHKEKQLIKNGHSLMSSFKSQLNIIEGIEKSSDIIFDSINSIRIPPFPLYKKLYVEKDQWSRNNGSRDISISYFNIKYFSIMFRTMKLRKEALKWARKNQQHQLFVFCFGMTSPFMKACVAIKKNVKNCTLVLINPDLPQFMMKNPSPFKKILKKIDWIWIRRNTIFFDKHILYSAHMAQYLSLANGSYITVEGSVNINDIVEIDKTDRNQTIVLYSGVIGKMYNIDKLIESFSFLDQSYELRLFGTGDYAKQVEDMAKKDSRIKYFGYTRDKKLLLQEQKNASILVSLINPEDEVSKYCFPSKIFEYLLSKNIVLSTRILGIPEEYFDFIVPIDRITPLDISKKIQEIKSFSPEERRRLTEGGYNFVTNQKNNIIQGKKIMNFVRGNNG